jgi:chain length determinant protein EpsF
MNIAQLLLALRARLGVFLLVLIAAFATAVIVTVMMPRSYKATVSLLADAKDEQSLSSVLRPLILPQERLSYLQTQMDILMSAKVARKVAQELELAQDPALRAQFERLPGRPDTINDWIADDLLRNLKVETSQSNVIQASFTAGDPRFAARVANAFAKAYIETMLELRVEPTREAAAWFDEQLKGLRASLEDAQKKLTAYHQRQGIVSSDERFDIESSRLTLLSEQTARAEEQAAQAEIRAREARESLQRGEDPDRLPEVLDHAFLQRLKADLLRGEARLQELATQFGARHPQYQRQQAENQSMRDKLEVEVRKVVAGIEASARQIRQRGASVEKSLAAQRARVLQLKETRNELTVLRRNVESAERAYDTAMQRSVVSRVESRANQTNIAVLNAAVVPSTPFRPRVTLNLALALAAGLVLGVGAVMLLETFDRRVRSPAGLQEIGDLPLLATLGEWRPVLIGRGAR